MPDETPPAKTAANILIVDDKAANLVVLESILEGDGYRLTKALSAKEALTALLVTEFALILIDAQMPEINGFELAKIIKERELTRDIPIIFITAYYAEDRQIISAYKLGAVAYITKPINPDILKYKVSALTDLYLKTKSHNA